MIYCSVKYCCSNSSIPGVILHSSMTSIKNTKPPRLSLKYTLTPRSMSSLYNSWWFCVHKLSMFIYSSMGISWIIIYLLQWIDVRWFFRRNSYFKIFFLFESVFNHFRKKSKTIFFLGVKVSINLSNWTSTSIYLFPNCGQLFGK